MSVKCAWASIDERGKTSGGRTGDQTGKEVKIGNYYNFGQTVILRAKSRSVGVKIAKGAELIANNSNVGYDQSNRTSLYNEAAKVGFDLAKIKTPCETDCSAEIAVLCRYAGITVSPHIWTGNMEQVLMKTGKFEKLPKSYINKPNKLRKGDIVLNPSVHVITVIEDGRDTLPNVIGRGVLLQNMPARSRPNVKMAKKGVVKKGTKVKCFSTHKDKSGRVFWETWPNYWIVYKDKSKRYIKRTR